jgi:biotin carboxyl carrier protein
VWVTVYEDDGIELEIDGRRLVAHVAHRSPNWWVALSSHSVALIEVPRFPADASEPTDRADIAGGLTSPMPGKVTAVFVAKGAVVDAGQLLVVVEAMKMEHRIVAPHRGVVSSVRAEVGRQVDRGAALVVIESTAPDGGSADG